MIMNRLTSLHITDSAYKMIILSTVLSYADSNEPVDSDTDDDRGGPVLMTKYCPPENHEGGKIFFNTLAYPTKPPR